ncbi:MAG: PHP domain-containing protein [Candidatus Zixiibacteriota bacterium]
MNGFDLHTHTCASFDCRTGWEQFTSAVIARGLTGVAITDHDTIEGALRLRDKNPPFDVIVGCEFTLDTGAHLIGLYLERPIRPGSLAEIAAAIHDQNGIVVLPHPFRPVTGALALLPEEDHWPMILNQIDAIEAFNAKSTWYENRRSLSLAKLRGLPVTAGSDAHRAAEIGSGIVQFSEHDAVHEQGIVLGRDQADPDYEKQRMSRERLRHGALQFKRAIPEPVWKAGKRAWSTWLDHTDGRKDAPLRDYGRYPCPPRLCASHDSTRLTSGDFQ